MSTFDGHVDEFPDIRIDYFRPGRKIKTSSRPPLAYFLSHVHTDHTEGLETCKSPFIYCSSATREVLLRLEKWPHRMNFAKGILESRVQHFRHLKKLLKPLPLQTPTEIDLEPGNSIRVTLFDANHCIGSVMFLIEGGGKAILYTGDIRSEPWWVNSLARSPSLLPYVSFNKRHVKRLDRIYIDTTFVVTGKEARHNHYPPKADGLTELLQKVSQYPLDTTFYFDAWTFGYEEVWQTLSAFLDAKVHLDDYRFGVYAALAHGVPPQAPEVPNMVGFYLGNHFKKGFITSEPSRLHSCEKSAGCEIWKKDFVRITPIIARYQGRDMIEAGAGGGKGDLDLRHELDTDDMQAVTLLIGFCMAKLQQQPEMMNDVKTLLDGVLKAKQSSIRLDLSLLQTGIVDGESDLNTLEDMPLEKLVSLLAAMVNKSKAEIAKKELPVPGHKKRADGLPSQITFPYSRHSSYEELCHLIEAFQPVDIFPCTTVPLKYWNEKCSMNALFGHLYDGQTSFSHDNTMFKARAAAQAADEDPSSSSDTEDELASEPTAELKRKADEVLEESQRHEPSNQVVNTSNPFTAELVITQAANVASKGGSVKSRRIGTDQRTPISTVHTQGQDQESAQLGHPIQSTLPQTPISKTQPDQPDRRSVLQSPRSPQGSQARRQDAFRAALGRDGRSWSDLHLTSTSTQKQDEEEL